MRCLSVKQPHAGRLASSEKTIELRSWSWSYRGPVIVCASGRGERGASGPHGVTVGIVELIDVRPATPEDAERAGLSRERMAHWLATTRAPFAWIVANARPVAHVPVKGQLAPWTPSSVLLDAITRPRPPGVAEPPPCPA